MLWFDLISAQFDFSKPSSDWISPTGHVSVFMMSFDCCLCVMMQISGDKGISAFPESDNLFKWVGTIDGAQGTVSSHSDKQYIIMLLMSCTVSLRETLPDKTMHDVIVEHFLL